MKSAFGVLRLTPDQFWSMTMIEFRAASLGYEKANSAVHVDPMTRAELDDMMERHPDGS